MVGYGPHPNECVELVASLPGVCIAGNHGLIATGRLSGEGIGELASLTLDWTRSALDADSRAWLSALACEASVEDLVIAHGSRDDPRRYVTTDRLAADELSALADGDNGADAGARPRPTSLDGVR